MSYHRFFGAFGDAYPLHREQTHDGFDEADDRR